MQPATLAQPVFARLANATWSFSQRYWRLVVVAMLLLLHIAVFRGVADPWARALLLAHLGLLLLWQPFLRAEQRVSPAQGVILSLVLALLAVAILPEIAPRREINADTRRAAEYVLPFLFVLIALFPAEPEAAEAAQIIDFFYSVFLMLMLMVVILGSFTFMTLTGSSYLESLTYTVFLTAAAVLLVGLAWNPRSGGGLGVFFARYLFSIGLPVERWLQVLAQLLQVESQPARFLEQAVAALCELPSVAAGFLFSGRGGPCACRQNPRGRPPAGSPG